MTETKEMEENPSLSCCSTKAVQSVWIAIDILKCNGCGLCGEVCPFGLPKKNSLGVYEITQPESCTECSACQRNCPTQAIKLQEQKGCGCLWDARGRTKASKNASSNSCCG